MAGWAVLGFFGETGFEVSVLLFCEFSLLPDLAVWFVAGSCCWLFRAFCFAFVWLLDLLPAVPAGCWLFSLLAACCWLLLLADICCCYWLLEFLLGGTLVWWADSSEGG